jgi:LemA protein
MKYEPETFESVRHVRTKFLEADTPARMEEAGSDISKALKSLFAVAENYPALKTNENFMQLQGRVIYLDGQMAGLVELYNDTAAAFNARIRQLPGMLVAGIAGYSKKELFGRH